MVNSEVINNFKNKSNLKQKELRNTSKTKMGYIKII